MEKPKSEAMKRTLSENYSEIVIGENKENLQHIIANEEKYYPDAILKSYENETTLSEVHDVAKNKPELN